MSIDTQKFATSDVISIPFGLRLKSAREARGLESKDVAAQLRLSEKMIVMIEKETYPNDLPVTFVRGYIRAYARLMEISDTEISKALEPIKPQVTFEEEHELIEPLPVTSSNYFMQFFTYLILLTIISLVGVWWYSEAGSDNRSITTTEVQINSEGGTAKINNDDANKTANITPLAQNNAKTVAVQANDAGVGPVANQSSEKTATSMAAQLIVNNYSPQFITRLILFLFIGFVIMRWQKREIKNTARVFSGLILLSLISLVGLWWYHYSQFDSVVSLSTSKNELPQNNPTVQAAHPSPKTESVMTSLPAQEIVPPNQSPSASQNKKDQLSETQNTWESSTNNLISPNEHINLNSSFISTGKYTPVPLERKRTAKTKRRNVVPQPKPVPVNEFSELDD